MIFTCANLRNKKCNIKVDGGDGTSSLNKVMLNDEELHITDIRMIESSLTKEHVNIVVFLSQPYKKKNELFLEYSWLQHNKKLEDEDRVETANKDCCTLFDKLPCFTKCDTENTFEGRFDGTYDMSVIYNTGEYLISPTTKTVLSLKNVESVFFERMASYQKNFDITFGQSGGNTSSIFTINRKKFYKVVKETLKDKEQYEGGPDPLPWPSMLRTMKNEQLNWKKVAELFIGGEEDDDDDVSSDWAEGSEEEDDDEDDDAEFADLVDEEEEEEEVEEESEDDFTEEEVEEEEEEDIFDIEECNSPKKRKYDSDSTDETEPKKTKL